MKYQMKRALCAIAAVCLSFLCLCAKAEKTDVRKLQERLLSLGYEIGEADGIAGENTWRYLNYLYVATTDGCLNAAPAKKAAVPEDKPRELKLGSFGQDVLALKQALERRESGLLKRLGNHYLFGLSTRRALERFQAQNGLPATGVLDEKTREKLSL